MRGSPLTAVIYVIDGRCYVEFPIGRRKRSEVECAIVVFS